MKGTFGAALLSSLLTAIVFGALNGAQAQSPQNLTVRSLQLVDEVGNVRGVIGADDHARVFITLGRLGETSGLGANGNGIVLLVDSSGASSMGVTRPDGSAIRMFADGYGQEYPVGFGPLPKDPSILTWDSARRATNIWPN